MSNSCRQALPWKRSMADDGPKALWHKGGGRTAAPLLFKRRGSFLIGFRQGVPGSLPEDDKFVLERVGDRDAELVGGGHVDHLGVFADLLDGVFGNRLAV